MQQEAPYEPNRAASTALLCMAPDGHGCQPGPCPKTPCRLPVPPPHEGLALERRLGAGLDDGHTPALPCRQAALGARQLRTLAPHSIQQLLHLGAELPAHALHLQGGTGGRQR